MISMLCGQHDGLDLQMGVITVFGGARSLITVACNRIVDIYGTFDGGKNLLRFKLLVG